MEQIKVRRNLDVEYDGGEDEVKIPWVCILVVLVFSAVFIAEMSHGVVHDKGTFLQVLGSIGPTNSTLERMGALNSSHPRLSMIFTSAFLHDRLSHLLFGFCYIFAAASLEMQSTSWRIGCIVLASGLTSSISSCLFLRKGIYTSGIGVAFGLFGAKLGDIIVNWSLQENKLALLGGWFILAVVDLLSFILPNMNLIGSAGGFITGLCFGLAILARPTLPHCCRKTKLQRYQRICSILSSITLLAFSLTGIVLIALGWHMPRH
ncbi:OLC1v1012443C4 [Oldenlandia corymbosa var. corymbosa]|uniref:RHOMBOID-like protein n=1 Tax=Oldenlandia corymbosa var. corymbosa TaxID=529605 RepID=A0AAV1DY38_OLDCO|nr:OLC1v1012443C4 [Oldenlandia corymbosa var. corymbosa]